MILQDSIDSFTAFVSSPNGRAALTAVAASAVTAGTILGYQETRRRVRTRKLKESIPEAAPIRHKSVPEAYPESLIEEQLSRNLAFLGKEGLSKLRDARIIIVGLGGVGSWAATMLVRSGASHVRLIDFDQVTLSSLNRHATATLEDVGTPKVLAVKNYLKKIAPWAEIEALVEMFTAESQSSLLSFPSSSDDKPTYVLDCIDNIDTKIALIHHCHSNSIPLISSMGSALKSDPSRLSVADISQTLEDPLSRTTRRRLRQLGITTGVTVVFSTEKPDPRKAKLLDLPREEYEKGKVGELSAMENFRVRILPVLGTMPGMFGLAMATCVMTSIAGYPTDPIIGRDRLRTYDTAKNWLAEQHARITKTTTPHIPVSNADAGYLIEEIFRGKSIIPPHHSTRIVLCRWSMENEVGLQNTVCMVKSEAEKHEKEVLKGGKSVEEVWGREVVERVEKCFGEEKYYSQWR
ncbi:hypothetical protein SAICODRAFT_68200 [Saitoella complicata NRRL Y-17804]|uniref:THIF-type NAD/FAD binding fold domain-containing protein n=1 Tax=Saitoella complicata (strain BCRC 22490 / CBS 7301 / JCM 7358 / NBRC 10748 / NRRL Y-17804) TaxID=698492 RepID=A0A0E9NQV2_SAICN|nr:uncharacterized protein SAICODRAFT_68200 [Saitoella complicata NRRL Y-17804]ODQ49793.1 hypothetical protein SAICODRAFT_68200 [Saitoella complicata NRRL Y-17804]GAO51800.1 hypothetical protein G7K_5891-t1 [Saitoella complicata NRRL Y-17804]